MLFTLDDNYTENLDERVSIEVEAMVEYRTILGLEGKSNVDILRIYQQIQKGMENEVREIAILVKDEPFIVVRGTPIPSKNLAFLCSIRSKWNPNKIENPNNPNNVGGYDTYWNIVPQNTRSYGTLTTYQQEQLLLRYQQDILSILEDTDSHKMIVYYTAQRWLEIVKEISTKKIFKLEATIEKADAIKDGDYDNDQDD